MPGAPFQLNVIYTVEDVAKILLIHPQTVRRLCREQRIPAAVTRGGFRITGWQIRDYAEGRTVIRDS